MNRNEHGQGLLGNRRLDLDVVRGVAILLAMGWHLSVNSADVPVLEVVTWPARTFGWAGVDLFFVLSGFLMGGIVFREHQATGSFDTRRFLVRRAFKLWPVFYVFLIAQLLFGDNPWETFFLQNAFHMQNYFPSSHAHLWSLAVEEHFYLVLAVIAPAVLARRVSDRALLIGLCSMVVIPLGLRIIGLFAGSSPIELQTLTHFRLDGLSAGVLLALLSTRYPEVMSALLRRRLLCALAVIAAILFITFVPKQSALGGTLGYTVTTLGALAFVLVLYRTTWVPKFAWLLKPIGWLGVYSYALYLWHIAAARLAERIAHQLVPGLQSPELQMVFNYACAISVAVILTKVIEWPALRLRNRLFPSAVEPLVHRPVVDGRASN